MVRAVVDLICVMPEVQVTVVDPTRESRKYVGLKISSGPGSMRLLLTRPYRSAGRTIDIPIEHVER